MGPLKLYYSVFKIFSFEKLIYLIFQNTLGIGNA